MRRTRWTDLAVPFVVVGITVYVLLKFSYTSYLQLKYLTPVPIVALALAELVAARRVRAAVRHDPRAKPMAAIVIARCVALGKASSVVGAAVAGGAIGIIVRLLPDVRMIEVAQHDATVTALLFAASLLLILAGLLLERAGIDPGSDRRES
jgi:branched-subunit amino acid ABC-type transport system permease component